MPDFAHAFARRTRLRGGDELTTILAGSPPGVLSMTGGFPNPATFPTDELDEIAARLVREDAAVALQYTPCEGHRRACASTCSTARSSSRAGAPSSPS